MLSKIAQMPSLSLLEDISAAVDPMLVERCRSVKTVISRLVEAIEKEQLTNEAVYEMVRKHAGMTIVVPHASIGVPTIHFRLMQRPLLSYLYLNLSYNLLQNLKTFHRRRRNNQ